MARNFGRDDSFDSFDLMVEVVDSLGGLWLISSSLRQ